MIRPADDEPEFKCVVCFAETFAEDDLCAWCLRRLDEGELAECDCGEVIAAGTVCICQRVPT